MFDRVLNTLLTFEVKEVYFGDETISLISLKNQHKIKALLNDTDVITVKQWAKMLSVCVATKSEPWNTLNYWV